MNDPLHPDIAAGSTGFLKIGSLTVTPPLLLAPMMDLTGRPFRALVRNYGGCGLLYSEMINSRRVLGESLTGPIYAGFNHETDVMVQLLGKDPEMLATAVRKLEGFSPAGFDLNMGCTRSKIMKYGCGAGLLQSPRTAAAALAAMRRATARPLTVKIRTVWEDRGRAAEFLRMLEDQGADAVIVHPRGVDRQRYGGRPDWEWLAFAKSRLAIPVIANGDVAEPRDALRIMQTTGCDGVMIGRAAAAKPYIFSEIASLLSGEPVVEPRPNPRQVLERYLDIIGPVLAEPKRASEFKTFCQFFAESLPVAHWFWAPLQSVEDGPELARRALDYFHRRDQSGLNG